MNWVLLVVVTSLFSVLLAAQEQADATLDNAPDLTFQKAEVLIAKLKFDSALFYLEPLLTQLEERDLKDSPLGLKLQLAISSCLKHNNRKERSMSLLQEIKDKSQELRQWEVFTKACLSLTYTHGDLSRGEEVQAKLTPARTTTIREQIKANLALAHATIIRERLDTLYPDYAVALATWHGDFGYNDSLKHYTRLAKEALADVDRPRLVATAYALEFLSLQEEDYRAGLAQLLKTIPIYKRLNDNVALSISWYRASLAHYRGGDIKESLIYNDSTITACYQAIGEGREETTILAAAYLVRGRAFRRLNQLDSALYYTRRGYSEEIRFIKQQEKYSIAEAAEKYNTDKKERQLKEKAQELAYEQQRTTGLILLSGLSLFFASLVVYAYSKLRKSNWVTKTQALQLREANEKLGTALERQVMLRAEIHHRVKNNLQIISGLLQSQSEIANDERVTHIISDAQERILSMSLIHQNLYQSDDLNKVSISSYIEELITNIQRSYTGDASFIDCDLRVEDEHLDIDEAIPLGLILNELITNAYKYAFPDRKDGKIVVELSKNKEAFKLVVSDNGIGLPSDYKVGKSNSLGLKLVTGLVRQLEGKISWLKEKPGTTVAIEF